MTTAWTHFAQGRPVEALRTHAAGTLLAVAALVAAGLALVMAVLGRRLAWQPGETTIAGLAVVMVALILCEWTWRLWAG